ncbi:MULTISPECIES: type IV toxin-antitoxin system AbiEi family antitoxin domain-containing protein [unclassified Actinomyces]|uniref:type IV toxin-antitoxin system AbiEi family antitoxin domain-containing protein n=1 Tax=unclassified Actinomyces TaxID=2609248 RepID=UPI0011BD7175|nr:MULTISPECIES: type IV toxin-antitoxin system AbiEi family antitoxin domain-containing protein [unclassified Actinomyces]
MLTRTDLRRSLEGTAFRQHGFFTAAQALDVGYSYQAQKYHADRGNWVRVDRGVFRLPNWPTSADDEYVRACLGLGRDAVISHETALTVHDLSDVNPARINVTVPGGRRERNGILSIHEGAVPPGDREERDGWRVTTVERTLADVASSTSSQEHLTQAVREALANGVITPRRLRNRAAGLNDRAALRLERAVSTAVEEIQ